MMAMAFFQLTGLFLIELKDSKPAIGMTSLAPVQNPSSLVALSVAFRLAFLS